jgi:hypothetical protein
MGLKIAEAFKDRCFLTVLATGAPATLLADVTCVEIDQLGNRAPLVVAEESDGWYTTSFTPDAAGTWATEWSKTLVPENYVFHYPFKLFKVGGGQEADIYTDTQALVGRLTAARAGYLDELGAANLPADLDTVLTRLTAARAGYFDNLSAGAVALASVCTDVRLAELASANLPADVDTLITRLTAARAGYLENINNANLANIVVASSKVNSQVKGIDDIDFPATQKTSLETAVDLGLDNALGTPTAGSLAERVKSLDDNYTAARAPYLDKLANHQISKIFFSTLDDVIDLSATAADVNLPDVILPNITGTIDMVYVGIIVNELENTSASGANGINVAQNIRIKKSTGAWGTDDIAAIALVDNQWLIPASTAGLSRFQGGTINVASEVDSFNATYNLRFEDADVDYDYLRLKDVQVFLMVYYH